MRRLIDEYGLAILYAIVGALCLQFFAMIFIGKNTEVSKVVDNIVNNTTNQAVEIQYNISYDLDGGYFRVLEAQRDGTISVKEGVEKRGGYYLVSDVKDILSEPFVDEKTGSKYFLLTNDEKLWLTYTRNGTYSLPHAYDKKEVVDDVTYNNLLFEGWTGSGLSLKTRNAVITKGSTGNRNYKANWTKGYYRVVYSNNLDYYKNISQENLNYKALAEADYDIKAWMSGSVPSKIIEYGSWTSNDLTINKNEYEFLGHKFRCWNTQPDGNGTNYYANTSILKDLKEYDDSDDKETQASITLYAQWDLIRYNINYVTTTLENASNTNPTTYRIIDDIVLKNVSEDDYQMVTWYTVNPYVEVNKALYKFGTYSWEGDAFSEINEPYYEFQLFNPKYDDTTNNFITEIEKGNEEKSATGTFRDQSISYGTYGDLTLYGYKTTGITVNESHLTWTSNSESLSIDTKWIPTESENDIIRNESGFEFAMTEDKVKELLKIEDLLTELNEKDIPGYKFGGLETYDGLMVFNSSGGATSELVFWNTTMIDEKQVKTWNYGKNLDLYVKWEPIKYTLNLHSNY